MSPLGNGFLGSSSSGISSGASHAVTDDPSLKKTTILVASVGSPAPSRGRVPRAIAVSPRSSPSALHSHLASSGVSTIRSATLAVGALFFLDVAVSSRISQRERPGSSGEPGASTTSRSRERRGLSDHRTRFSPKSVRLSSAASISARAAIAIGSVLRADCSVPSPSPCSASRCSCQTIYRATVVPWPL